MFVVLNKEKIKSYILSVGTVAILFVMAFVMINNKSSIETAVTAKQLPIYSVDTKEKNIALTMNCAWTADDMNSILDTLAKYKINITFFMVGDFVDKYPEVVKKIAEAGHEIGNHSDSHPHVNQLSMEKNMEQIKKASDKIEKITGKKTTLYRAPYGEYNNTVIESARAEGHTTIQWNIDSLDYKNLTGEEMWKRIEPNLNPRKYFINA